MVDLVWWVLEGHIPVAVDELPDDYNMSHPDERRVGHSKWFNVLGVEEAAVSTVFLRGTLSLRGTGVPPCFETMIFCEGHPDDQRTVPAISWEEAEQNHEVARLAVEVFLQQQAAGGSDESNPVR